MTLKYFNQNRLSVLMAILSFFIRTAAMFFILLYVVYFGKWMSVLFWLTGLILARIIISRYLGKNLSLSLTMIHPGKRKKLGKD